MAYDNIKTHKKPRFHRLFRRRIVGKTSGRGGGEWVAGSNRPWTFPVLLGLTNENVKEKERKKFLIFVMFTLA